MEVDNIKAINLTFKESEHELFAWICKRSNKSGFIKDILQKEKEREEALIVGNRTLKGFLTLKE